MINDKISWLNNWLKTDAENDILLPSDQACDIVLKWMHQLSDATTTLIDIEHEISKAYDMGLKEELNGIFKKMLAECGNVNRDDISS